MKYSLLLFSLFFCINAYSSPECEWAFLLKEGKARPIQGANNVTVNTYAFEKPESDKAVVIVPGLGDSSELIEETIRDFHQAGYSVFTIDHRGQGRSAFTEGQLNSHVDDYHNYIADFTAFMNTVVKPQRFKKTFLFGNSMGGAIGFLYLRENPGVISKAVFLAPMYGLPLPSAVTNAVAMLGSAIQGPTGSFITNLHPDFENNFITTNQRRYQEYEGFFQAHPEIPGYSPSHNWMVESNRMMADVNSTKPENMTTPIQIFTAGHDKLVNNYKTNNLAQRFPNINVTHLPDSKHSPHFEGSEIWDPLLKSIIKNFQ